MRTVRAGVRHFPEPAPGRSTLRHGLPDEGTSMRQRATFSGVSAAGLCVVLLSGCGITSAVTNKVTSVIEKPKREEETKYSMARLHERNSNVRQAEELLL